MGVTPCGAFQIFSSVFLKEGENMYVGRQGRSIAPLCGHDVTNPLPI